MSIREEVSERGYTGRARFVATAALIASVYGVVTVVLAPISFGPIQVRLTDALLPIAFNRRIGFAGVAGVAVGALISNVISPFGLPDLVLGPIANLIAGYAAYLIGRRQSTVMAALAGVVCSVVVAVLIGFVELDLIYGLPALYVLTVFVGELVSCVAVGLPLLRLLNRRQF